MPEANKSPRRPGLDSTGLVGYGPLRAARCLPLWPLVLGALAWAALTPNLAGSADRPLGDVAQSQVRPPLCATFSIVARDTTTGEFGVAVQSHWFSVGSVVPWAEAGVGAVATQSFVEPAYGPRLLARMRAGENAASALVRELEADSLQSVRQVIVIDARGNAGAQSGEECIPFAGHRVGKDHVCAGNLLAADGVWDRMSAAFLDAKGPLAERMLAALEAGQKAGGDSRGMQSAALLVVRMVDAERPWKNRVIDLRVEDNASPIEELRRLYTVHQAYTFANLGDEAFARKDFAEALRLYDAGLRLAPGNDEILFWRGSMKMGMGDADGAAADCALAMERNPRWKILIARIPESSFPGVETVCARLSIPRQK